MNPATINLICAHCGTVVTGRDDKDAIDVLTIVDGLPLSRSCASCLTAQW